MIAITVGRQQISKDVIKALSEKGYPLKVLVSCAKTLQEFENFKDNPAIQFIIGGLLDVSLLDDLLEGVDTIIHLDEMVSFNPKEKNEMYLHNVQGTANVVNLALYHNVKKIIYLSSVWAFGEKSEQQNFNEEAKWVNIKNAKGYGWSKHLAEREIWRGVNEGLEAVILNAGYVTKNIIADEQMKDLLGYFSYKNIYPEGNLEILESDDILAIILKMIETGDSNEQYILSNGTVSFKTLIENLSEQNDTSKMKPITTSDLKQKANFRKVVSLFSNSKYSIPNKLQILMLSDKRVFNSGKIRAATDHQFIEKEISLQNLVKNYRSSIS